MNGEPDAVKRSVTVPVATCRVLIVKSARVRQGHGHIRVVSQIAPNSGEVLRDGYAQLPQLVGVANAGQGEDVRASDCARAQDYFFPVCGKLFAAANRPNSNRSAPFNDYAERMRIRAHRQIVPARAPSPDSPSPCLLVSRS